MKSTQKSLTRVITTTISEQLAAASEKFDIRWCDALAFGIKALSTRDEMNRNIFEQLEQLRKVIKAQRQLIFELSEKHEKLRKVVEVMKK